MGRTPHQVEHSPSFSRQLDTLAAVLGLGGPDQDQSDKNPDCALEAGTIACMNAADPMCDSCGWWSRIAGEDGVS